METYLIGLVVDGRACIVCGGDREALDKTRRLAEAGARVTLIASDVLPELAELVAQHGIVWHRREVLDEDLADAPFLVISTARDAVRSRWLYERAKRDRFLLSCTDQPLASTFIHPAVGALGPVNVGFVSGGRAPALIKRLRDDLVTGLGRDFVDFAWYVAAVRKAFVGEGRREALREAMEGFRVELRLTLPEGWRARWQGFATTPDPGQ